MTINRNLSILAGGVSSAGVLGVPNGGSGATTLTGYLIGNGTGAFTASATIPTSALSGTVNLTSQVSGILPFGNGGTGLSSTPANGALDIGNGTGFTRTTLTAGNGISVTNASGSITVANTQNTGPAFMAYGSAGQSIANGVFTKIAFNTKTTPGFDTNSNYDAATNYRFTPTVGGYYQINANIFTSASAAGLAFIAIYKNGSAYVYGNVVPNTNGGYITANGLVYCNGSTDYIEIYAYQNSGISLTFGSSVSQFQFSGAMIRGT
jgi:hypothetical protein